MDLSIKKMNISSLNKAIYEQTNLSDEAVIADLGCRNASFLLGFMQTFPGKIKKAYGVDVTGRDFKSVCYPEEIELKIMDCSKKLQFDDATFDFVFTKDMFECISDKESLVREIHRILKPGGFVISVNCDWDSIVYNGDDKALILKVIHAYAVTKQPWMDNLDSWIGRRMFGFFNTSELFESSVTVHNVVETEYREGFFGYDFSKHIGWLADEKTGVLTHSEYRRFIKTLEKAYKNGNYIFSKPYYICKGIKK